MPRLQWLSRRELIQTSGLVAAAPSLSGQFGLEDEPLSTIDSVAAYLGIPSFSYGSVAGELWYRTVDTDPDCSNDCIYRVEQNIVVQDCDITSLSYDPPAGIDARFELRVIPSVTPEQPPSVYQQFASMFDSSTPDDQTEPGVTTSDFSVGSYPGLSHVQDAELTGDDMNLVLYTQTTPWGVIHWTIIYDPEMSVEVEDDEYRAWLHRRLDRDQNRPSMAPKSHWNDLHDSGHAEKGWFRGDIQPILSEADDSAIDRSGLQQVEQPLSGSAAVDHDAAIAFAGDQQHN